MVGPRGVSSLPTNRLVYQLADVLREERARADRLRELFSSSSSSSSSSRGPGVGYEQSMGHLEVGVAVDSPCGTAQMLPVCGYDCEESSRVPASCGCVECGSLLCSVCEGLHGRPKPNKSHRVLPCGEYLSMMLMQM